MFCDFCEAEIPIEIPSKLVTVLVEPDAEPARAAVHRLEKDACTSCGDRIRRILNMVDGAQVEKILEGLVCR
jgi:hypothetical protein